MKDQFVPAGDAEAVADSGVFDNNLATASEKLLGRNYLSMFLRLLRVRSRMRRRLGSWISHQQPSNFG